MRILFVTPYPPSCYRVRSYGFIRHLRHDHEVTVLSLCHSEREMSDVQALRQQGYEVLIVREARCRAALRSGLALLRRDSLHAAYARSAAFSEMVRALCQQRQFDIVHVEHLRGMIATQCLTCTTPLLWDAVDCISLLYQRMATSDARLCPRLLARWEYRPIQQYEARLLKAVRHVVVASALDQQAMLALTEKPLLEIAEGGRRMRPVITVVPNGVNIDRSSVLTEKRRFNIVFSGKMNYPPNAATALYLYEHIMPLIWQRQPRATLTLAGGEPPPALRRLAVDPRVEVTGFVPSLQPYIERAEVMLCPLLYGTGIQNKVLEALAAGTPVVASPQAVQATTALPGRDLLVAESPEEFASATLQLLEDATLRATLSQRGCLYVEQHHNWQSVTSALVALYQQVIIEQQQGLLLPTRERFLSSR